MKQETIIKTIVTTEDRSARTFTFIKEDIIFALANYCKLQSPGLAEPDLPHCEFNEEARTFIYVTKLPPAQAMEDIEKAS